MLLIQVYSSYLVLLALANPYLIDISLIRLINISNPILLVSSTPLDIELKRVPLLRNINQRYREIKPISTIIARQVVIIQQSSIVTLVRKIYSYYSQGLGLFTSYIVLVFKGTPYFKGSYANYNFNASGKGYLYYILSFLYNLFYLLIISRR